MTTGDVIFCEHVGRKEPERLLPPSLSLPESLTSLRVEDYQDLVDTIHMDNEEGVQYRVLKVYKSRDMAVVDRILYDPEHPDAPGGIIDTVFLGDVIGYPIILGGVNPRFPTSVPIAGNREIATPEIPTRAVNESRLENTSTSVPIDETLHQKAKRLRSEAILASEVKNTAAKYAKRSQRVRSTAHRSSSVTKENYDAKIAKVIIDWACDHIPEELWEPTTSVDGAETYATSSSGASSITHQYTTEPKHHAEAMGRASECEEWIAF